MAGAHIIFFAGVSGHIASVMEAADAVGLIGASYAWIGFDGFMAKNEETAKRMQGSLRLMSSGCPGGPAKNELISSVLKQVKVGELARRYMDYSAVPAHPEDTFTSGVISCAVGFTYDAVWLAALAFGGLNHTNRTAELSSSSCGTSQTQKEQGRQYYQAILDTAFDGASGRVSLLSNGDRATSSVAISIENFRQTSSGSLGFEWVGEINGDFALPTGIVWAGGKADFPSDGVDFSTASAVTPVVIAMVVVCASLVLLLLFGGVKYHSLQKQVNDSIQKQKLTATDMDLMVRSGKVMLLLHQAMGEASRDATAACASLSSFVTNAGMLTRTGSVTVSQPPSTSASASGPSSSSAASQMHTLQTTASAIKAFDLWRAR